MMAFDICGDKLKGEIVHKHEKRRYISTCKSCLYLFLLGLDVLWIWIFSLLP